jgi:2,3-dihydroxy-2,3-dihydrophenylpropionate dehydrogenase
MGRFDGQVVFITGAGTGLGRGLLECFVEEGAKVGSLEQVEEKVEKLRADVDPDRVVVEQGDVQIYADNRRAVAVTVEKFGRLDVFVQCAGITDWTPAFTRFDTDTISQAFDDIMRVNVLGATLGALASAPELRKTNGSMIFTLSTSGFFPGGQGALYTLSKHALNGLVRQLAYELAPDVRVNGIVPGAIRESRLRGPEVLGQHELYPEKAFPEILADRQAARLASGSIVFWDSGISITGHGTAVKDALDAAG